jgi:hypothetical protein
MRTDSVFMGGASTGLGPEGLGVGPMAQTFTYSVVPVTANNALIASNQTLAGAGNLTLTSNQPDIARAISLTSAGNLSTSNFTVTGTDFYGFAQTQTLAGPNANTVNTTKAFKTVTQIAASAAVTGISAGTSDIIGLPVVVPTSSDVISVKWAALAQDAGTLTVQDTTSPATASTGDVRGTYLPSSASNGTRKLVITLNMPQSITTSANRSASLGVTPA